MKLYYRNLLQAWKFTTVCQKVLDEIWTTYSVWKVFSNDISHVRNNKIQTASAVSRILFAMLFDHEYLSRWVVYCSLLFLYLVSMFFSVYLFFFSLVVHIESFSWAILLAPFSGHIRTISLFNCMYNILLNLHVSFISSFEVCCRYSAGASIFKAWSLLIYRSFTAHTSQL